MPAAFPNCTSVNQAWLQKFLQDHGYNQIQDATFSNGRSHIRLEEGQLVAISAGGSPVCRSDISQADETTLRTLLSSLLTSPGFISQSEVERRHARQEAAQEALQRVARTADEHPDFRVAEQIKRFLWSLYNGHHPVSLWKLKCHLDSDSNALVTEIFVAWMQGHVTEDMLRKVLPVNDGM